MKVTHAKNTHDGPNGIYVKKDGSEILILSNKQFEMGVDFLKGPFSVWVYDSHR